MNSKIKYTGFSWKRIPVVLAAVLLVFQVTSSFAADSPENVRIEDGVLLWDPVDGAVSYNIYATTTLVNGNGYYVATVLNETEFQPTFKALYTVVAFYGGTPAVYSDIDAGQYVQWGDDPILTGEEIFALLMPTMERNSEIRTNRCTDVSAWQGCTAMCDTSRNWVASGGACRAEGQIILHQRTKNGGYECLATSGTAYVETDVICLKP